MTGGPEKGHGADGRGGSCRGPGRQGPRRADPQRCQAELLENGRLIEQRRLLLRPRIVASIKRMDQPGMLGDAAFRDAGSALRREGQTLVKLPKPSNVLADPRPNTRIRRGTASRCSRWRASRLRPRGGGRSVLSRALFCEIAYCPRDRTPRHFCCPTPCPALFPPPASCEICRRHCRRPPQHRSGDIVGEFFHP